MSWLFALIGAFVGAALADTSDEFMGLATGVLVGWLFGSISRLKTRIAQLEGAAVRDRHMPGSEALATSPPNSPGPAADWESRTAVPGSNVAVAIESTAIGAPNAVVASAPEPPDPAADNARESVVSGRADGLLADSGAAILGSREATLIERAAGSIKSWFSEGNVPVKVGMLVLFFGVAALLKYAVDQKMLMLPVEFWFALVAGVAVAGLIFGWRQRETRRVFGLAAQGGALGVLLLTVFAAFRLYHLLPAGIALGLVVILVAGSALLAVLQNALALAVLGFTGGFLAPVLISTGSGNHVALFAYYALLNAAVFAVAWLRPWRVLNLVGFGFTFVVGSMWGYKYYTPANFATVEPFLILFFLFYVGIGVLYVVRQPEIRRPYVDGTLTFGTPLLAFPLQAALLRDNDLAMAFSALGVALLYAALFAWLRRRESFRVQGEAFAGLALGFATLAVPLALSAQWTASTWALEGAALVWLGLREDRRLPQFAGLALQLFAGAAFVWGFVDHGYAAATTDWAILNGRCLGAVMLAFAGFFIAWQHERHQSQRALVWIAFLWACSWWTVAGWREIDVFVANDHTANALVAFTGFSIVLASLLRGAICWGRLGWIAAAGIVLGLPLALGSHYSNNGPFEHNGWMAWVAFAIATIVALQRLRAPLQRAVSIAHVAAMFLAPLLFGLQLQQFGSVAALADGWRFALTILPLVVMFAATWRAPTVITWPLADLFPRYRMRWFIPAATVLLVAWFLGLGQPGDAAPLPFIPLVNPLELMQISILLMLWFVVRDASRESQVNNAKLMRHTLLLAGFLTLTFATLRAVHQSTGLAWDSALIDSMVAQTSLTVVWSILGVGAWIAGSKRGSRPLWLAGAVLMGIVLAKLVLVDRQHVGNIPGIVSFIAVGLLLTVVGYFAPSPPRRVLEETPQ